VKKNLLIGYEMVHVILTSITN